MPDPGYLAANLRTLHRTNPRLAAAVANTGPASGLDIVTARSGCSVPRLVVAGRPMALHSVVDPRKEAERIAATMPDVEYLVCLGMGAGYHLGPLLERSRLQRLLVVEHDAPLLRGFLSAVDLSACLDDPRLDLVLLSAPGDMETILLSDYHPVVYRSFGAAPLRTRVDAERVYFSEVASTIERSLVAVSQDHTTQARFGWRWHRNILANIGHIAAGGPVGSLPERLPFPDVAVVGAGPSLDRQMPDLAALRSTVYMVATDASVTPLTAAGLRPDAVMSIDCQHIVYHHFMGAVPEGCTLVMDIASPPYLARGRAPVFVSTRHPLAGYLVSRGACLPYVDVTGGNVSHAAVSLADGLGASRVLLLGVDLSYPLGAPYARGSFLYAALAQSSARLGPLESQVAARVLGSPSLRAQTLPGGVAYLTDSMAAYRRAMGELAARIHAVVLHLPGDAPPLDLRHKRADLSPPAQSSHGRVLSAPEARRLLVTYADELSGLPAPAGSFPAYLRSLDRGQRETLATLLPPAAAQQARDGYPPHDELLAAVRKLCRAAVVRAVSA
jgi:hypothetical protein